MHISAEHQKEIAAAIRAVEVNSTGEIVCVLARTSSDATALPVFLAALGALVLPWLLIAFTALAVERILTLQIVAFLVLVVILCLPRLRVALMPRAARRHMAHRAALEQFEARGIARKKDRCGVLIFVSLAERYARIVADEGIAARVPQAAWQAAVDALITHMKTGDIAQGFIVAIELCGKELAAHFPRTDASTGHELPDRIYVI
jgi:putative membrane protein